jgi:hypothetical protein
MFHMKRLSEWIRQNWLGSSLWALFVWSTFLMVKSSSDQLLPFLQGTAFGQVLSQFPMGNQIIFDVTVGSIVSLFIYVLVVWVPERSKEIACEGILSFNTVFMWSVHTGWSIIEGYTGRGVITEMIEAI